MNLPLSSNSPNLVEFGSYFAYYSLRRPVMANRNESIFYLCTPLLLSPSITVHISKSNSLSSTSLTATSTPYFLRVKKPSWANRSVSPR